MLQPAGRSQPDLQEMRLMRATLPKTVDHTPRTREQPMKKQASYDMEKFDQSFNDVFDPELEPSKEKTSEELMEKPASDDSREFRDYLQRVIASGRTLSSAKNNSSTKPYKLLVIISFIIGLAQML